MAAWFTQTDWRVHPLLLGGLTLLFVYTMTCQHIRWFSLLMMRRPKPKPLRAGWRVGVATTIVPEAESLEMLATV
jgi:hypothetical protein